MCKHTTDSFAKLTDGILQPIWLVNTNSNSIYIFYILNLADEGQQDWHTLQLQLKTSKMLNVTSPKIVASLLQNKLHPRCKGTSF